MIKVALGLGSNLGNRRESIDEAIAKISGKGLLANIVQSAFLDNKAVLPKNAPKAWDRNFLNVVIVGETLLTPTRLLDSIKNVEKEIGRVDREKWAPREIDIDILLYGGQTISMDNLIVPHKLLLERKFAVCLLESIQPEWKYPGGGEFNQRTLKHIVNKLYYNESIS